MRHLWVVCLGLGAWLCSAAPATAQFRGYQMANPATGETYKFEIGASFWSPSIEAVISSESLGIVGTPIDFVEDLGIEKRRFRDLRLVLRPARKHKFRIHYLPMDFRADTTLERSIVFNGIRYDVGLPVRSTLDLTTWRLGYEYDFLYRDRWFVGVILEAKYTEVDATLTSLFDAEFVRATATIPAIGGIVRGYVARNISLTAELTAFKVPERLDENYSGQYIDYDLYGTINFTNNVGVQVGIRSLDAFYRVGDDEGDLRFVGAYFAGVGRF